jgi:hypothetical protein
VCTQSGGSQLCMRKATDDQASVHQMIVGVNIGGTF